MHTIFNKSEEQRIVEAIKQAEDNTSGEIRVHIEEHCKYDVVDRAVNVFEGLGMAKTDLRNGVLFYIAFKDKKFAVIGDKGINEKVPENFWNEIKEILRAHFKESRFTDGLVKGIALAGVQLGQHFPRKHDDKDELTNTISFNH